MDDAPRGVLKPAWLVWLFLSLILAGYVTSIVRLHPTNFFGATEDDSIYFSSAKALAEGRGYILPSVPGTPPATKYPILYPLILSAVWKLNPSFPANLPWAIAVTVGFGFVYIVAGFLFLRRLQVLHDAEVLLLTAFCAFHPVVLFYSASVLSDIPFAALALVAMLLADSMLKLVARPQIALLCGVVAGLSVMMRMFGLAIVAGILLAIVSRRAWKQMLLFCAAVAPFFTYIAWRASFTATINPPVLGEAASSVGWVNTWAYYTNYFAIWKAGVPNVHILWAIIQNNIFFLLLGPARLLNSPLLNSTSTFLRTFSAILFLVGTIMGAAKQVRATRWAAIHFVFPCYALIIIFWNYSDRGNRFLAPFVFGFIAAAYIELRALTILLAKNISARQLSWAQRGFAAIFFVSILYLAFGISAQCLARSQQDLMKASMDREPIWGAKKEAYLWLARSACCLRILAYEDANVYLYSGQFAVRPVTFVTSALYDHSYVVEAANHVTDVARAIKADYWVFLEDDFSNESQEAAEAVWKCIGRQGPGGWPVVFESSDGRALIRSLGADYLNPCTGSKR